MKAPVENPAAHACPCRGPEFARVNDRLMQRFSRHNFLIGVASIGAAACWPTRSRAAIPDAPKSPIAFVNARVFDGKSDALQHGMRVVVSGQRIESVEPAASPLGADVRVIDCGGRTLMPGLIDAHWHAMMAPAPLTTLLTADIGYINLLAADEAEKTLMRGFTSIRDMAGPTFGLKRAIDSGITPGPRIWPSGAMISQTGGHGDFRFPFEVPSTVGNPLTHGDQIGAGAIADGHDAVLLRAREQLMLGASQLKLAAGGGVASYYDPIDVSQYTETEFRAAADAAENWGTYVAVHAYTSRAIQTAIKGGVTCIEHGHLMDEKTAAMMAEREIWLSTQAFLANEYANAQSTPENKAKQEKIFAGTDNVFGFAKKYKIKTAWGTDILFNPKATANQGAILTTLTRWFSAAEILRMATATNAELLAKSGPRNPYPRPIGVVEKDAYADLLLVDGDPIANIKLIADPAKNLAIVMKDGRIYRNMLPTPS